VALPSLGISRTANYAAFLGICAPPNLKRGLNFFLCHPKIDFLRDRQNLIFVLFLPQSVKKKKNRPQRPASGIEPET